MKFTPDAKRRAISVVVILIVCFSCVLLLNGSDAHDSIEIVFSPKNLPRRPTGTEATVSIGSGSYSGYSQYSGLLEFGARPPDENIVKTVKQSEGDLAVYLPSFSKLNSRWVTISTEVPGDATFKGSSTTQLINLEGYSRVTIDLSSRRASLEHRSRFWNWIRFWK